MDLERWLSAAADAASEIARGPLGIESAAWRAMTGMAVPDELWGASISLSSSGEALHLGLFAERATCVRLTRALLGLPEGDTPESDADIFDAIGEVTNLIAGTLKARLAGQVDVLLGVPRALHPATFSAAERPIALGVLRLDLEEVWVVLVGRQ